MRVAFRFDDLSSCSDWALERGIIELFRAQGMALTLGVIPFVERAGTRVSVRDRVPVHLVDACRDDSAEIALHGHSHKNRTTRPGGLPTEFRGVPHAEQGQLIRDGLEELRSVFGGGVIGFVPPYNSFDANTVAAAKAAGLRYVSGGFEYEARHFGVPLVPRTCLAMRVPDAVVEARRYPVVDRTIVALIHHYDLKEGGSDKALYNLAALADLLAWLKQQKDVKVVTIADLAAHASAGAWSRASWLMRRRPTLPGPVRRILPTKCLLTLGMRAMPAAAAGCHLLAVVADRAAPMLDLI